MIHSHQQCEAPRNASPSVTRQLGVSDLPASSSAQVVTSVAGSCCQFAGALPRVDCSEITTSLDKYTILAIVIPINKCVSNKLSREIVGGGGYN